MTDAQAPLSCVTTDVSAWHAATSAVMYCISCSAPWDHCRLFHSEHRAPQMRIQTCVEAKASNSSCSLGMTMLQCGSR